MTGIRGSQGHIHRELANRLGIPVEVVKDVCHGYFELLKSEISKGRFITINNFGAFNTIKRKGEFYSNLFNKMVEANTKPHLKPSPVFIEQLNSKEVYEPQIKPRFIKNLAPKKEVIVYKEVSESVPLQAEIKELKKTVSYLGKVNTIRKTALVKCRANARKMRKYYSLAGFKHRQRVWAMSQRTANTRASEIVYDKFKVEMVTNSSYMNAITYYPMLTEFYKSENLDVKQLNLFIVIAHFHNFHITDAEAFGYTNRQTVRALKKLMEVGLVEKFGQYRASYSLSFTGRNKFIQLNKDCVKKLKLLFRELDKKKGKRNGGTPVKVRKRFLSDIDILAEKDDTKPKPRL